MAERITFSELTPGVCQQALVGLDGFAVSISEPRVIYAKAWHTSGSDPLDGSVECGAGTSYPLEVTLDQLAEIFYRVKDSAFSGTISISGGHLITVTGAPAADRLYEGTSSADCDTVAARGYTANLVTGWEPYFGAAYGWDAGLLGSGTSYDVGDNEQAMWILGAIPWLGGGGCGLNHSLASNGFENPSPPSSYSVASYFPADTADPPSFDAAWESAGLGLIFSGYVAVTGDGNPTNPDNRIFVGMGFGVNSSFYISSLKSGGYALIGATLRIVLGGGDTLILPLYADTSGGYTYSGSITVTATKWWPYKTTAGDPAWDSTTGLPINGGPGA